MYDCTMVLTKGKKPLPTFASSKAPILELKLRSVKLLALQQSTSSGTVAHPLDQLLARHGHELEMDEVQFRILFCFEHPTKLEWQLEMCMCVCVWVWVCACVWERARERAREREKWKRVVDWLRLMKSKTSSNKGAHYQEKTSLDHFFAASWTTFNTFGPKTIHPVTFFQLTLHPVTLCPNDISSHDVLAADISYQSVEKLKTQRWQLFSFVT